MSLIEAAATLFGVAAVVLTIRQNILCWPVGLVQVTLFIFVFYRARLYSDVLLHIIYIFVQAYGWYNWRRGGSKSPQLPVTTTSRTLLGACVMLIALGTIAWGYFMDTRTDASVPYPDAFVAVGSLVAHALMTRKKLETWVLWIIVDLVALPMYLYKELYLTAGLYVLLLAMGVAGFLSWRKTAENRMCEPGTNPPNQPAQ